MCEPPHCRATDYFILLKLLITTLDKAETLTTYQKKYISVL